jgi:hypothetical protein
LAPAAETPIASMVVISEVPTLSIGVMQDRVAIPSICTVQAPQRATPQPNFVPVRPRTSRSTQSSGMSPSTSTLCVVPLTLMAKAMASSPFPSLVIDGAIRCRTCAVFKVCCLSRP